ncbi:SatD family protein [Flavobacterium limicola]|uniref:SatD family protein n=1 Tax=Flavobacterium limicola TaxID=180441 RepID=A0A495S2C3_9FLAO|nr:SatD family protein [Flavobacterium limicola]RKS93749.1 SatD family protein [Flavobacterium limicola]
MKHYILMADIIDSGKKEQKPLMEDFKNLIEEINEIYKADILSPLTITLGDEFQGVIKNLATSIQIILTLEENCIHKKLNFKLRYVLNQGEIETPVNEKIAYEMLGSGLTEARLKLNDSKYKKFRFNITIDNLLQRSILNDAFTIFENIKDKWSLEKDYELVSNFIQLKDYKIVSEKMNKTRSLIWKREKTLQMESYNATKNIIHTITSIK